MQEIWFVGGIAGQAMEMADSKLSEREPERRAALPGPSRPIRVEPVHVPEPRREPAEQPARPAPPEREPRPVAPPKRAPVPA